MKKFFLFFAAVAALSLASCGGDNASSSVADGQSQNPGIDPNAASAQPPQVSNNAPSVEENNASTPSTAASTVSKDEQQNSAAQANEAENPEATNIDPNA